MRLSGIWVLGSLGSVDIVGSSSALAVSRLFGDGPFLKGFGGKPSPLRGQLQHQRHTASESLDATEDVNRPALS